MHARPRLLRFATVDLPKAAAKKNKIHIIKSKVIKSFLSSREAISFRCCVFFSSSRPRFPKRKEEVNRVFYSDKKKAWQQQIREKKVVVFFLCSLRLSHRNKYFKAQISQV